MSMNMVAVYNQAERVAEFVSIGIFGKMLFDDKATAIGLEKNGNLIAGVVYTDYRECCHGNPLSIDMSIYTIDKKWASRHNLSIFFGYPFAQLKLERVSAITSVKNEGAINLLLRLGFKQEGFHPISYPDKTDAISFGMLRQDCRWIHGQKLTKGPSGTRSSSDK